MQRIFSLAAPKRGSVVFNTIIQFICVFTVLLLSSAMLAQQPKQLRGRVLDPLGALVPQATVELLDDAKVVGKTTSGADGSFQLALPEVGRYRLRVAAKGFQTTTTAAAYASGAVDVTLHTPTLTEQVTVTATGFALPEAQTGASVTVLTPVDSRFTPEAQDTLRLVPGLQVTQVGQIGGTTALSIRGGATPANKVLVDGVPVNTIGGAFDYSNIASVGIDSIEVLREPNSAIYGSDALAGVIQLTSTRAGTKLPLLTYQGDAGNFRSYRNQVSAGVVRGQFDLYSAFGRMDTDNNLPNSEFHNATYAGNFGWTPNSANDVRFTVRHLVTSSGQPNAIAFYGIADDSQQKEHDTYYNAAWNGQTLPNWHNQVRYDGLRQNGLNRSFGAVGVLDGFGDTDGLPVTITGANGYSVHGQAYYYYCGCKTTAGLSGGAYTALANSSRDLVYAESDYRFPQRITALGAFQYENLSGSSSGKTAQRGNYSTTLQISGDVKRRLFYQLGSGLENNGLYGFAATPRASLAYYLARPTASGLFSGTKLHGTFGKGIKEPNVYQQNYSLYNSLLNFPATGTGPTGAQVISQDHIGQIGPEESRTFDGGLDQQLFGGRAHVGVTYFHNQFTNGVEYVPATGIEQLLGISPSDPAATPINKNYGAYINSLAFRSQGVEVVSEYRVSRSLFARGGYTYIDPVVQNSFSSAVLSPTYNTSSSFSTIRIGAYSPLKGARPFRVAPHSGYFGLDYRAGKFNAGLTGTLVGRRDDSTYLSDANFGNSLLLPNHDLLGGYERLDLGLGYAVSKRVEAFANVQNLLSEHYFEAFGYPSLPLTVRAGVKVNFGGSSWGWR
jgi:iron complex outermembrane receptor protein/vitamin B12 transporter